MFSDFMASTTMTAEKYPEGKISESTNADLMRLTQNIGCKYQNCTPVWDIIPFYFIDYQP